MSFVRSSSDTSFPTCVWISVRSMSSETVFTPSKEIFLTSNLGSTGVLSVSAVSCSSVSVVGVVSGSTVVSASFSVVGASGPNTTSVCASAKAAVAASPKIRLVSIRMFFIASIIIWSSCGCGLLICSIDRGAGAIGELPKCGDKSLCYLPRLSVPDGASVDFYNRNNFSGCPR